MSASAEPAARFSFLSGANADFIAELYARYLKDPSSVTPDWGVFFKELNDEAPILAAEMRGAAWAPAPPPRVIGSRQAIETVKTPAAAPRPRPEPAPVETESGALFTARQSVRALMLIRAHRAVGHMMADLDPLGLKKPALLPECDPAFWGFTEDDYDRPIFIDGVLGLQSATLRQIIDVCRTTYCRNIGYEFLHIQDHGHKQWIQEHIEGLCPRFDRDRRRRIYEQLVMAEGFEKFLAAKFSGTKRFGVEGAESLIPALLVMLERGAELGADEFVLGMAHRGRLNVLANILRKPYAAVFAEFQGAPAYPDSVHGSGDVKYHLGTSCDIETGGKTLHLSLSPNPSHLEYVNPVVAGRVRAKAEQRAGKTQALADSDFTRVAGILIHGDAAFAGQGVVAETMELAGLRGYRTGGTVHVVVNNQIGFTTTPEYAKSTPYCTDIAKSMVCPIFHVNGDNPDAVVHAARLAIEFRQRFKRDVVLEIVCYRRQGHNEGDEPAFTQPAMYKVIRSLPTTREIYAKKLVREHVLREPEVEQIRKDFHARLEADFAASATYRPNRADWLEGKWSGMEAPRANRGDNTATACGEDILREVARGITRVPDGFALHPRIARQFEEKVRMVETGAGIDWATAEALAFGALVLEGTHVRLSGQDCGRGTFSQRHAAVYDQETGARHIPLRHIRAGNQAPFEVHDSPLSESAVLGFEFGYSTAEPNALIMWEAQFGDFANGAQVIIDQFVSCAEAKWLRMSGLTLLLPHGYEGQGPEHSSGRLERFLQLSAQDNWQVANCSTPAQYFHILRRQVHRSFRKPLVLMTPKSLLRHRLCVSPLSGFTDGSRFHRVLPDPAAGLAAPEKIRRAVLCSGKVYYDLLEARAARKISDVALVRVEELYPFPKAPLLDQLRQYPNAEVVWCQEEPQNMGAWHYIDRQIETALKEAGHAARWPAYVGRPPASSPATGHMKHHIREQSELVEKAIQ